jgi:predicted dehydrogenase
MSGAVAGRLRLGVVGCGRVFERFHLPALGRVPEFELVSGCDRDPGRVAWFRDRLPGVAGFGSLEQLVRRSALDAVLILTPPATHAELAVRALESGLHVLVEKPMALHAAEARAMAEAAVHAGRRLQVGFNRRFRDPYRRLRTHLAGVRRDEFRSARFELAFPASRWGAHTGFLGRDALGGGVLDDVLSHQADVLCWLLGAPPEAVRARIESPGADAERAHCELRFAGGLLAECSSAHGPYAEYLELGLAEDRGLVLGGSYCVAGRSALRPGRQRGVLRDRLALVAARLLRRPNLTLASFAGQLRDFALAVRGGGGVEGAGAEAGVHTVEIVEACRESARTDGGWRPLG